MKSVILLTLLTLAHCSDFDTYLGKALRVAIFPRLPLDTGGCIWHNATVVSDQCACGNDTETAHVKLLSYKHGPDNQDHFAVSIVNTAAEVFDALTKYKRCKCGDNTSFYDYSVYRPINENFYIQYFKLQDNTDFVALLAAKSVVTKAEIEKTIQSVDNLKTRAYSLLCDYK